MRLKTGLAATGAVGSAVTLLALLLPGVRFAYELPRLHVAFETAEGLIALLLAYLAYGRFRVARAPADYVLTQALAFFAATSVVVGAVPRAAFAGHGQELAAWAAVFLRLLGTATFAAAPWASGSLVRSTYGLRTVLITTGVAVAAAAAVALVAGEALPAGVDPASVTTSRAQLREPVIVVVQLISASLFALAAYGFARQAARQDDELLGWVGIAAVASVFARVNYALFPSIYSGWVYTGDFLRLGFYALLLVGAAREIRRYWDTVATTAKLDERRRVARDLHDGVAQELAFVATQSRRLARGADVEPEVLARAAERALDESRRAIAALTSQVDEPLEVGLADAVRDVASRAGVDVQVELHAVGGVDAAVREQLIRVVREAASNAVRHGRATTIKLSVRRDRHLSVCVTDDGIGFDVAARAARSGGFGLISMQERVEALGGKFSVRSSPGAGTAVEIEVPQP